ncbi:MAG: dihydropteroate synthase [Acidimicrobiales bacterium]
MRPLVMGVLNVTPDSFSDGGRYLDPDLALARGLEMVAEGADIVDVGGESSRPGADPVPEAEECRRVLPVIAALCRHVRVSVDTVKPGVADAAVEVGATLVNDISATLWPVAARHRVGWVAMHMQGTPRTMQKDPRYADVASEVRTFVLSKASEAAAAGVDEVWIDPGIGFGKTVDQNLALLRRLPELAAHGFPLMVGTSRKSFLGRLTPQSNGRPAPAGDRLAASLATATWALVAGAGMVRVHDVAATVQAATLVGPTGLVPA